MFLLLHNYVCFFYLIIMLYNLRNYCLREFSYISYPEVSVLLLNIWLCV